MIRKLFERRGNGPAMDCEEVGRVLQQYLDSEVTVHTATQVAEHLEACRRCGLEAGVYRDLKTAIAHRSDPREDSVARLREFGHTLSRGTFDARDLPSPS